MSPSCLVCKKESTGNKWLGIWMGSNCIKLLSEGRVDTIEEWWNKRTKEVKNGSRSS